ncbi:hypothetical protein MCETALH18_00837 [Methylophilaceae bacterium]
MCITNCVLLRLRLAKKPVTRMREPIVRPCNAKSPKVTALTSHSTLRFMPASICSDA